MRTWLTIAEAAAIVGITRDNILRAIHRGTLPATRLDAGAGSRNPWTIRPEDLADWQARTAGRRALIKERQADYDA